MLLPRAELSSLRNRLKGNSDRSGAEHLASWYA